MEPLNSVALGIVHWSSGGSDIKSRHSDLEDMCYESRPIIRVNYRRDPRGLESNP